MSRLPTPQVLDVAGTGGIVGGLLAAAFFDPSTAQVTDAAVDTALGSVESALPKDMTTAATNLGAAKTRVTCRRPLPPA